MKPSGKILLVSGCILALCVMSLVITGCGGEKKITPLAVGEMQDYRDPGYGFQIHFPKDWYKDTQVGRAHFYNAEGVNTKFLEPTGAYPNGVVIAVDVIRSAAPLKDKDSLVSQMKAMNMEVGAEEPVTIGGKEGMKVPYTARYSKQIVVQGYHIFVPLDTLLYDIGAAGFGDLYEAYKPAFDSAMASFQFPKPREKGRDETLPSESFAANDAKLFTFEYPDNFNFETVAKGSNELALSLRGVRRDCSIMFHVFGAKGLTLEKVVDQNKGRYAGASSGKATLGGVPALTLTYSASRDVERRFVFAVKDDKVYRVTLDWFKPQRAEYLAAYEKVISSFKFK